MKGFLAVTALLLSACSPKMTNKDIIGYITHRGESHCKSRDSSLKGVSLYMLIIPEQNERNLVDYMIVCTDDQVYSFEE